MLGPRRTRSVRAIPATPTRRDRTTSGACRCRISDVWRADASTRHGRRSRSDRRSIGRFAARWWSQSASCVKSAVPRYRDTRQHIAHRCVRGGRLIADPVGEIIAGRKFTQALITLEIERYDANSVSPQVQALSTRAPGTGDEAVRRRRCVPLSRAAANVSNRPGSRRRAPSARTAPPDESSQFALGARPGSRVAPFERRR
jgi:hypothetical protein